MTSASIVTCLAIGSSIVLLHGILIEFIHSRHRKALGLIYDRHDERSEKLLKEIRALAGGSGKTKLSIANDFSPYPGGLTHEDGPFNAQCFREQYLLPSLKTGRKVIVSLDGLSVLPSNFIYAAFGGLSSLGFEREYLKTNLIFTATDPSLSRYIDLCRGAVDS